MVERKRFSGIMDTDSREDVILPADHKYALNARFYGTNQGLICQAVYGNMLIPNSNLPIGTNQCIGSFFDSLRQRIIWFNYNSNGNNGIYQYSIKSKAITTIFLCGTDSATDILNFSPEYPVHSVQLVFRTQSDGDLLYWTDGNNRPKYLNIDTVQTYVPFIADMLNAGKNAPLTALTVDYVSDSTITTNNLRKKLFRFAFRLIYADLSKSTISPISEAPLPEDGFDQDVDNNPLLNNVIELSGIARLSDNVTIGDIVGVEILGQMSLTTSTFSDLFLITTIPRSEFVSGTFSFSFLNDSVYTTIPVIESDLYFSWLPDKANTLELLNGNVIIYGGITEGYPNLQKSEIDVLIYAGLGAGLRSPVLNIKNITDTLLSGIVGGTIVAGGTLGVQFVYDNGVQFNLNTSYTNPGPGIQDRSTATTDFVAALNAEFVSQGISGEVTAVQVGSGNTFTITSTNPTSEFRDIDILLDTSPLDVEFNNKALKWASQYRWGIIYFDERGKTNGVISYVDLEAVINNFNYVAPNFATMSEAPADQYTPYMMASINHLPPYWAKRFQWVRTPNQTTNSFIELVTNDYQTDADYLYFCIQNLTYLKTKNSGFLPSYEFSEGDRIRVIAEYDTGNGDRTAYNQQLDFEILGVETRTMNSPASDGRFIKVRKPSGAFPSYTANNFIELYTPLLRLDDEEQLFFEFGQTFEINANQPGSQVMYHGGNLEEQNATQPATFLFYEGDVYFKPREFFVNVDGTTVKTMTVMDPSYSDYFPSKVNSDGRGWTINVNAKTEYNTVLVRWGQAYQQDTSINQLNIFYSESLDTYDRAKGAIQRLKARDRILRVFQERACGQVGVYAKFIQDNAGQQILTTTDQIITTNNINYYQGEYGLGDQPTSLVSSNAVDYFTDPVRGYQVRLSGDGITPISELYKGQFYIRNLIMPFGSVYTTVDGYKARINGAYDYFDEQYIATLGEGIVQGIYCNRQEVIGQQIRSFICTFQGTPQPGDEITINVSDLDGNDDSGTYTFQQGDTFATAFAALAIQLEASGDFNVSVQTTYPEPGLLIEQANNTGGITGQAYTNLNGQRNAPQTFSFNEPRNGYCSFYSYFPEWIASAQDVIYTWLNGQLWSHNSTTYCNFYGQQFDLEIDLVFNQNLFERKTPLAITETCNTIMTVPLLYTDVMSFGSQRQESNLVEAEFQILEGKPSSAFRRDVWSRGGKINGQTLKASYLYIKLRKSQASELVVLSEVDVKYIDSPFNAT